MTDVLGAVAASWGVLMAISPALQIRRMLDRRSSADISISYLSVLQVGFMLWIAYGVALRNAAIIVPNSVAFLVGVVTILIAVRFREGRESGLGAADGGRTGVRHPSHEDP